ncbi:hypothetical protein ACFL2M_02230 [Patescibacteria group bacterium]
MKIFISIFGASLILFVGFTQTAHASAYYDDLHLDTTYYQQATQKEFRGDQNMTYDFTCGWFCGNTYTLSGLGSGKHSASYPGKDGKIDVYFSYTAGIDPATKDPIVIYVYLGSTSVTNHGWVKLLPGEKEVNGALETIVMGWNNSGEVRYCNSSIDGAC